MSGPDRQRPRRLHANAGRDTKFFSGLRQPVNDRLDGRHGAVAAARLGRDGHEVQLVPGAKPAGGGARRKHARGTEVDRGDHPPWNRGRRCGNGQDRRHRVLREVQGRLATEGPVHDTVRPESGHDETGALGPCQSAISAGIIPVRAAGAGELISHRRSCSVTLSTSAVSTAASSSADGM